MHVRAFDADGNHAADLLPILADRMPILRDEYKRLVALEVLFSLRKGKKASELLNVFKPLPQILENIIVKDKNVINKTKCKNAINKANMLMGKNGRILVRKSGTEPKIRIMAESHNRDLIYKCIKIIKSSINN